MNRPSEKLPSQDIDAEVSTLGGLLLDNACLLDVRAILPSPDAFYTHAHRLIYAAILRLDDEKRPFDPVIISELLERDGHLREIGGDEYLHQIIASVPYSAHGRY